MARRDEFVRRGQQRKNTAASAQNTVNAVLLSRVRKPSPVSGGALSMISKKKVIKNKNESACMMCAVRIDPAEFAGTWQSKRRYLLESSPLP